MSDGERVVVKSYVEADRAAVWQSFTDPAELARWWWPMFDDTQYELQVGEGCPYRIHTSEGGFGVSGQYIEVEAPRLLRYSWIWHGGDLHAATRVEEVTVTLEGSGDGTLVTVTQTVPLDETEAITQGWEDCLVRLEEHFDES